MSNTANKHLEKMWARGCEFLGTKYAILGGAMSWISESGLVSAISNAGGFGVIAGGSMMPDQLGEIIVATQKKTDKPFGVNMVTMHPELDALIDKCLELNVKFVVLAGGLPSAASIKRAKDGGAKVICFAPALALAKRLVRNGADALVIEG
ncbi:MAG: nitronate monooxygenase, partial [Rhodospirillaceae bacterium]|nr:nitronate monooxygenase [Rhodospirillaceae bacterium]